MKTVLFGGTFNPVHIGHMHLAEELRTEHGFDQVIFVPSFIPPHKQADQDTDPMIRLEMVKTSVETAGFLVDDCEIHRKGVSYTYDTVSHIYDAYKVDGKLSMVIGDDLLEGLGKWNRLEELIPRIELLVARRTSVEPLPSPYPHRYLRNLLLPVSSEDIRKRVREERAYRFLVPESVYWIIRREGLYRG